MANSKPDTPFLQGSSGASKKGCSRGKEEGEVMLAVLDWFFGAAQPALNMLWGQRLLKAFDPMAPAAR